MNETLADHQGSRQLSPANLESPAGRCAPNSMIEAHSFGICLMTCKHFPTGSCRTAPYYKKLSTKFPILVMMSPRRGIGFPTHGESELHLTGNQTTSLGVPNSGDKSVCTYG